jgi:hypothetical protein
MHTKLNPVIPLIIKGYVLLKCNLEINLVKWKGIKLIN